MRRISLGLLFLSLLLLSSATNSFAAHVPAGIPEGFGATTLPPPTAAAVHTPDPLLSVAHQLLIAINKDRELHKAPALTLDVRQSICSSKHSHHMAMVGFISHDQFPSDVCIQYGRAAENVGVAYGQPAQAAVIIHHLMMNEGACPHYGCPSMESEAHGHYINLMNLHYRRIGIGLYVQGGALWVTENFTD